MTQLTMFDLTKETVKINKPIRLIELFAPCRVRITGNGTP